MAYDEIDYDAYWDLREKDNYWQPRFPIMEREIEENQTVLDIGCGDGAFLFYVKERKKINELGIDISNTGVKRARDKGVNALVKKIEELDHTQRYDCVTMSEVIEHVPNAEYFFQTAFTLAKRKLIITLPNTGYYTYRLRLLFGSFPVQWVQHPAEHLRFWTIRDFKRWIKSLKIEGYDGNLKIIPSNGFPYLFLHRLWPNMFGKQIVYILEKKESNSVES